jgi:hypothetical protein
VTSGHTPGILLLVGSVVFGVGAAVGVPVVFAERDPRHASHAHPAPGQLAAGAGERLS